jgi:hypothetical protein
MTRHVNGITRRSENGLWGQACLHIQPAIMHETDQ